MTPEQRSLRARIAATYMHLRYEPEEVTAPARRAFLGRFEREVDPLGCLPEAERKAKAHMALRGHMLRLALASSRARQNRSLKRSDRGASVRRGAVGAAGTELEGSW